MAQFFILFFLTAVPFW